MSVLLPTQWWAELSESDRLAYADAVLSGEITHHQWRRLRDAGIATWPWEDAFPQVSRYLPVAYRRLIIDWVRQLA
jgi:hypothetical protein